MKYGLKQSDLEDMDRIFSMFDDVEKVVLFGSRAKGTYKPGSDIDIALKGRDVKEKTVSRLAMLLNEESLLPYFFDVVNYTELKNKDFIEHIDRVGVVIYSRGK